MEKRSFNRYDAYLLLTALLWGTEFPITKVIYRHIDPLPFLAVRNILTLSLLFILLRLRGAREPWRPLTGRERRQAVCWGALGIGICPVFAYVGLQYNTAGNTTLVISTAPIFCFLFAALLWRARTSRTAWLGVMVSFAGIFLLMYPRLSATGFSRETLLGDVLIVLTPICWALYTNAVAPLMSGRSPFRMTVIMFTAGTLTILAAALPGLLETNWSALGWPIAAGIAYQGFVVTACGSVFWNLGIARLGSRRTIVYEYVPPVIAWGLGVLLLAEPFHALQMVSAACVFAGMYLARGQ